MTNNDNKVRTAVPLRVLWKWSFVSAILHVAFIAALCALSYAGHLRKEASRAAVNAAELAAAKEKEKEEAQKADANKPPPGQGVPTNAPVTPTVATNQQAEAEKILGLDKVAKPGEKFKSPFSSGNADDLLKDLK